jgi:Zn-dependent protease with chaperone function
MLGSIALAVAAAEGASRVLAPRRPPTEPAAVDLETYFSAEEVRRGARFARPQLALGAARAGAQLGALAWVVRRSPRVLRTEVGSPKVAGAIVGAGLATALTLPPLPLAVVARRRAIAVGLVTQSWRGWAGDMAKATGIQAVFAAGAGAGIVAATRRYPRIWWAPASGASVLFGAVLAALAPVILDPIFNDFTPLPEGETRADVLDLARAAQVKVRQVYSVDASRRTTAANAYVTGLGPTKRVVLFDTLLERYGRDEVRVVVAHELAHVRNRDVPRSVVYATIVAPAGAFAVQQLSWALSAERGTPAAIPALALAAALLSAPLGLIGNRLSRAVERRADDYSLELSRAPEAFVSFERAIALQNVADLDPPRWISSLVSTHPSTLERIGAAVAWRNIQDQVEQPGATPAVQSHPTPAGS